jgi:4'-phosphopantetheinyl transferase
VARAAVIRSEASPTERKLLRGQVGNPPAKLELGGAEIDVWHCFLDAFDDRDAALAMLDAEETARYGGFVCEDAARQFLAGRTLRRMALSCYANVPERLWTFATNEHGRPTVDEPCAHRNLYFNLSHTSGVAVLAVGRIPEIGIDVESIDRPVDIEGIARVVFTQSERDSIFTCANGSERDRFFDLWTLKEAYMKARGRGFSLPPDSFALASVDGHISLQCSRDCDPSPERWQFCLSSPRRNLRVALAIGSRSITRIRTLTCSPLTGEVIA